MTEPVCSSASRQRWWCADEEEPAVCSEPDRDSGAERAESAMPECGADLE